MMCKEDDEICLQPENDPDTYKVYDPATYRENDPATHHPIYPYNYPYATLPPELDLKKQLIFQSPDIASHVDEFNSGNGGIMNALLGFDPSTLTTSHSTRMTNFKVGSVTADNATQYFRIWEHKSGQAQVYLVPQNGTQAIILASGVLYEPPLREYDDLNGRFRFASYQGVQVAGIRTNEPGSTNNYGGLNRANEGEFELEVDFKNRTFEYFGNSSIAGGVRRFEVEAGGCIEGVYMGMQTKPSCTYDSKYAGTFSSHQFTAKVSRGEKSDDGGVVDQNFGGRLLGQFHAEDANLVTGIWYAGGTKDTQATAYDAAQAAPYSGFFIGGEDNSGSDAYVAAPLADDIGIGEATLGSSAGDHNHWVFIAPNINEVVSQAALSNTQTNTVVKRIREQYSEKYVEKSVEETLEKTLEETTASIKPDMIPNCSRKDGNTSECRSARERVNDVDNNEEVNKDTKVANRDDIQRFRDKFITPSTDADGNPVGYSLGIYEVEIDDRTYTLDYYRACALTLAETSSGEGISGTEMCGLDEYGVTREKASLHVLHRPDEAESAWIIAAGVPFSGTPKGVHVYKGAQLYNIGKGSLEIKANFDLGIFEYKGSNEYEQSPPPPDSNPSRPTSSLEPIAADVLGTEVPTYDVFLVELTGGGVIKPQSGHLHGGGMTLTVKSKLSGSQLDYTQGPDLDAVLYGQIHGRHGDVPLLREYNDPDDFTKQPTLWRVHCYQGCRRR